MVQAGGVNFVVKAAELRGKADAALKGGFFSNFFHSKQDRRDEAKELYQQAANCYKHAKDHQQALQMYMRCIECETDDGFKAGFYKEAAMTVKQHDSYKYLELIQNAIKLYQLAGRMSQACSMCKDCAEKLEEDYNYEQARDFFEQAASLYEIDNQLSYANQMSAKWADLTILMDDNDQIAKVIKTFDKIGKKYLTQSLVRSSARDYFFKAVLCFLANDDLQGAKNSIENYQFEDPSFDNSRQYEFLKGIIDAIEAEAADDLQRVVRTNARILTLDRANNKLLVTIKKLYCPDEPSSGAGASVPGSIGELDLVNGGETSSAAAQPDAAAQQDAGEDNGGDGYNFC